MFTLFPWYQSCLRMGFHMFRNQNNWRKLINQWWLFSVHYSILANLEVLSSSMQVLRFSGIWSGAHGYSDRGSGSDVTTTAYKGRGALPTETVVPKPQSSAKDHWWPIATHGWRRQVLVRLEVLHHDHSDNPDSHTSARYPPLGLIQIRPSACTVILKLILFQNIVEPTRIWNKA